MSSVFSFRRIARVACTAIVLVVAQPMIVKAAEPVEAGPGTISVGPSRTIPVGSAANIMGTAAEALFNRLEGQPEIINPNVPYVTFRETGHMLCGRKKVGDLDEYSYACGFVMLQNGDTFPAEALEFDFGASISVRN